jgi:cephalosporin-C deacetylase
VAHYDLTGPALESYRPLMDTPSDFDAFWDETLSDARTHDLGATFELVDNDLSLVESYDVTFHGFGGAPVRGWLQLPRTSTGPLAAVVQFVGYGGGRGLAHEHLLWANAGYAHLVMDTRGQGSIGQVGDTPDPGGDGGAPSIPGQLTRGVRDPYTYYYRRLITDAVRAIEAIRCHPRVDPGRVVATGYSQGGLLTLAVAALVPDVRAAMADVPFLCDVKRAVSLVDTEPYVEIARYLQVHRDAVDEVFATLSYVDGVNFAARGRVPALFSVGLMDPVCPPSTVFGAYNTYAGAKAIHRYPYNGHEGGQAFQDRVELRWLRDLLAKDCPDE